MSVNSTTLFSIDGRVYGSNNSDVITSGNEDDQVYASEGNNQIITRDGDDLVYAGSGDDFISTGLGDDTVYAAEGDNTITTGGGDDLVYAGSGDDSISTGSGNDLIYAAEGDNLIRAGTGEDTVYIGSGADRIILEAGEGAVTVYGFNLSNDQLELGGNLTGQSIHFEIRDGDTLVRAGNDLLAVLKWTKIAAILPARSTSRYQITDLGALDPRSNNVRAAAINDEGQIAGRAETGEIQVIGSRTFILNQGFIWENGVINPLPSIGLKVGGRTGGQTILMPGAGRFVNGINNQGVVVGAADEVLGQATDRGTYWQQNQTGDYEFTIYDFGGVESYFFGINNDNQIAGRHIFGPGSTTGTPNRSKPIYWENGLLQDLPTLNGDTGTARSINNKGQIVGQIDSDGLNDKTLDTAVLWEKQEDGTYDLINLGTFGAAQSIARDINESGQVVGWTVTGTGTTTENSLFLWEQGVNTDLGNLGGKRGETSAINDFGQIVGYSQNAEGKDRAFLWDDGQMYDLNELLEGKLSWKGEEITLTRATDINNAGDITGYGTYTYLDATGREQIGTRSFLLSAVTEALPLG